MFVIRFQHDVTLRSLTITALLFPPPSWDMFFLSFKNREAFRGMVDEEIERQRHNRMVVGENGVIVFPTYETCGRELDPPLKCKIIHADDETPPSYDNLVRSETPPPAYGCQDCM